MTVAANKNPTVVLGKHFGTSSFRTNPNKIDQSIRFLPVDAAGDAAPQMNSHVGYLMEVTMCTSKVTLPLIPCTSDGVTL